MQASAWTGHRASALSHAARMTPLDSPSRGGLDRGLAACSGAPPCDPSGVSQIEVRAAEPDDLVALLALYAELTDGTPSAAPGDPEISRTALKHVLTQANRHLLVAVLDRRVVGTADPAAPPPADPEPPRPALKPVPPQANRHLLVAVLDGRVVGTADLAIVPNITHRGTPWGIIENVVVAGAARRRGAARALFGEIERLASAAGCPKVSPLSGQARVEGHRS